MCPDYYEILGVPKDADAEHIRKAFRTLARQLHPDRAGPEATARFQRILEAYRMLTNFPDSGRSQEAPSPTAPSSSPIRSASVMPMDASRPFITPVPMGPRGVTITSDALRAQLPLSWWETRRGGSFQADATRLETCGHCGGSGLSNPGICSPCGGSGRLSATHRVTIDVPAETPDGAVLHQEVSLPDGKKVWVIAQVRVL